MVACRSRREASKTALYEAMREQGFGLRWHLPRIDRVLAARLEMNRSKQLSPPWGLRLIVDVAKAA